ncbi:MAG: Hsp20/alpha crystallin family protein [Thermodesulfobacteriota bacterium]
MRRMWSDLPFGGWEGESAFAWSPKVDLSETDKEITVKAELPGLKREDIDISLDERSLVIKGEKKSESEETGRHFHRVERTYGCFYRALPLPATVEQDKIEATYKDGILTVVLPKTEEARKKLTHIEVH